ncbi:tyrosine-type recombinase/integrase [Metapseudomonas otitidis]|uniref:tyrosine-type recombinase/integrase n=1 Tax=Metapseudomonas otitidis TaxID=319939 RepID=UPI00244C13D3|nr:integrase arm-type DNA-binding domain-containing protein [Pseudomonas otitidis]MDG9783889.1 tyrosine-type recombinase/integrase [Pseudomonas otitidis]
MPITDTAARQAKPKDKPYTIPDTLGLSLYIAPSGVKSWHFRFTWLGRQARISLGVYPDVSLKDARQRRDEARAEVASGVDPRESRKERRAGAERSSVRTFAKVYEEWLEFRQSPTSARGTLAPGSLRAVKFCMQNDVLPFIGTKPIGSVTRSDVIAIIRRIERRGSITTAVKTRQWAGQVFRYAIAIGDITANPTAEMHAVTEKIVTKAHRPFVAASQLSDVMDKLRQAPIGQVQWYALMLMIYTACRPGEARFAEWSDFDLDSATWTIPAERMKARRPHIVPLPRQAVDALQTMLPLSEGRRHVFVGNWDRDKPIGANYATDAMLAAGLRGTQSPHGFRHMFSTEMNGRGYNRDWIERQLAHIDPSVIRDTYNHATYLDQRRVMMQEWADLVGEPTWTTPCSSRTS